MRNDHFLGSHGRVGDLLRAPVGADMSAFIAEELPGSIMRGVPRDEWMAIGLSDEDTDASPNSNTAERFEPLVARVRRRIASPPTDGGSHGSALSGQRVDGAALLAAFAERAGGEVLFGVPDRGAVLALPADFRPRTDSSAGC